MRTKILVVDNEQDFSKALKVRLKTSGYDVILAFDSVQAYVMAHKESPDLIILETFIPGRGRLHRRRTAEGVCHNPTHPDHLPDRDLRR